jgi:competence protein ComEC
LDEAAGVAADVLWPEERRLLGVDSVENENSVVLRLCYASSAVLLTGDIGREAELRLAAGPSSLEADVLKVSHHGSDSSTTPEFLARVGPRIALIGVGEDNAFSHPSPKVLGRLGNVSVWRTDLDGTVEVLMDGHDVWVRRR